MDLPIQITFRGMEPSDALEARIRERAQELTRFYDRIESCRIVVEAGPQHQHRGRLRHLVIHLVVPGGEVVVNRDPAEHHAHEDVYVAIRDAFDAARRQLEDHVRRLRGDVKSHK